MGDTSSDQIMGDANYDGMEVASNFNGKFTFVYLLKIM